MHPVVPYIWYLDWMFIQVHTMCLRDSVGSMDTVRGSVVSFELSWSPIL